MCSYLFFFLALKHSGGNMDVAIMYLSIVL